MESPVRKCIFPETYIGGSYPEDGLSNITLQWLAQKAEDVGEKGEIAASLRILIDYLMHLPCNTICAINRGRRGNSG